MDQYQGIFLLTFALFSILISLKGLYESANKNNSFGLTDFLFWMGIFVWGDAVVFGVFWFGASVITYLLRDWLLFLLIVSVFWAVRSLGETIYWLNQQFSTINRNPPENLRNYHFFKNDSIWFIYQVFWQCVTTISIIFSLYLGAEWLKKGL